jgi:2-hydroxychromene-2-carboxylate isomerase
VAGDGFYGMEVMMKTKILAVLILIVFAVLVVGGLAILTGAASFIEALLFALWTVGIGVSVPAVVFAVMWAVLELFGD